MKSKRYQPSRKFTLPQHGETISCNNVNYYVGQPLGRGAFGIVYECTDDWGNQLAAKVLLPQNRTYEQVEGDWFEELIKLVQLRHPKITYIHQAFEYQDAFYIIVEFCKASLENIITLPSIRGDIWLPYIARDILHGLDYIHNNGYIHKDLHPGNIFISEQHDPIALT